MDLRNDLEAEVTHKKLRILEARCQTLTDEPAADAHIRALTLQSLGRMINQMKEELVRYELRGVALSSREP